jgi:release factor glutamine methyltransferase
MERELKSVGALSPRVEAERILEHCSGVDRLHFYMGSESITQVTLKKMNRILETRKKGVPLAHAMGQAPFYGRTFLVSPDTLIPRPETEVLVEESLAVMRGHFKGREARILDLGTGSGCIAISLTMDGPPCRMTALDASPKAVKILRKNMKRFKLGDKIKVAQGFYFSSFGKKKVVWDMIVSNPPYVPDEYWPKLSKEVQCEPTLALLGGPKGMDVIRKILSEAWEHLSPGGFILMEIGKGQSKILQADLKDDRHYKNIRFVRDLNGIDRIFIAEKNG